MITVVEQDGLSPTNLPRRVREGSELVATGARRPHCRQTQARDAARRDDPLVRGLRAVAGVCRLGARKGFQEREPGRLREHHIDRRELCLSPAH